MLVGNGSIYFKNPMRSMAGAGILNDIRINRVETGPKQNQATIFGNLAATPAGYYAGSAWILPTKAGAISSRNAGQMTLTIAGNGAMGLNGIASGTLEITSYALGQLIAGAVGSLSFSLTASGAIVATIGTTGTGTLQLTGAAVTGAIGWLIGNPNLSMGGSLISYANGFMEGTTDVTTELTPDSIARSVWEAVAAELGTSGTMGELLKAAGAGGNPWVEEIENNYNAKEALQIILSALAGKVNGAGTDTVIFRDVNDNKDRISAQVDGQGNRTGVTLDVS